MFTKEMFMQSLPFTVERREGVYQYDERTYGGELIFSKYGKCKYIIEIEEITERFVTFYFFEDKRIIYFKDCSLMP